MALPGTKFVPVTVAAKPPLVDSGAVVLIDEMVAGPTT